MRTKDISVIYGVSQICFENYLRENGLGRGFFGEMILDGDVEKVVIEYKEQSRKKEEEKRKEEEHRKSLENKGFMYCKHCGKKITEGSNFCIYCGKKVSASGETDVMDDGLSEAEEEYIANHLVPFVVAKRFDESGMNVPSMPEDNVLVTKINFDGGSTIIVMIFNDDGTHLAIRGNEYIHVPEEKYARVYKMLNECNNMFIQTKFVLDEENGQIYAYSSSFLDLMNCGDQCLAMVYKMVDDMEKCFPKLMKALWA